MTTGQPDMGNDQPSSSRLILTLKILGPLLLTIVATLHPQHPDLVTAVAHDLDLWLTVHVLQLPIFGLVALSLFYLPAGHRGLSRTINLVGIWLFLVFYTAMDTLAGIASGVLVSRAQNLPQYDQQVILDQISSLSADFSAPFAEVGWPAFAITVLGGLGWIMATTGAAVALRRTGAPLFACLLIGLGALYFMHDVPAAPFAAASLLTGSIWAVISHHRRAAAQAASSTF